jgi:hypothetical protein
MGHDLGDGEGKHFRADNFLSSAAAAAFRMINAQQQQSERKARKKVFVRPNKCKKESTARRMGRDWQVLEYGVISRLDKH